MPKGLNLRCSAGRTARVCLQGKNGRLTAGQALVLLPVQEGETDESPVAYRASLRQALIDDNVGHVNIVVCEADYTALKGHRTSTAAAVIGDLTPGLPRVFFNSPAMPGARSAP